MLDCLEYDWFEGDVMMLDVVQEKEDDSSFKVVSQPRVPSEQAPGY